MVFMMYLILMGKKLSNSSKCVLYYIIQMLRIMGLIERIIRAFGTITG